MTWLENSEIRLRAVEPEDLDRIYAWENDSSCWIDGVVSAPFSYHQVRQYVASTKSDFFSEGELRLIVERKADRKVLGCVDLCELDVRNARAAVSVIIEPSERRKGYASASLRLLADYAFRYLRLSQIYGYVRVGNAASMSLFGGLGFEATALMRRWVNVDGRWSDVRLFQLFASGEPEL